MNDQLNPYRPSAVPADSGTQSMVGEIRIASSGRRLVNLLIDTALALVTFFVVCIPLGIIMALVLVVIGRESATDRYVELFVQVAFLPVYISYYFIQEVLFGKTVGKFITGTRVVNSTGGRTTKTSILLRSACRLIPFEFLSYVVTGNEPVGLHDWLSGTRVIRV